MPGLGGAFGLVQARPAGAAALLASPAVQLAQLPLQMFFLGDSVLSWPLPGVPWAVHTMGQGGYQHIPKLSLQQPLRDCSL